ncbi:hypothetical protein KR215_010571 [Drosophila sulfurigaster]|nr:hypothetical protein KR215_010571 [Drosophila sulfurigaster]
MAKLDGELSDGGGAKRKRACILRSRQGLPSLHALFNVLTLSCIIISDLLLSAHGLKDLKIFVPEAVIMGNAATLSCQYDLEQAALYSVRWYFNQEEFYRYVPREAKPTLVFLVSGINVDLANSDATSVTLKGVTRELTGSYQCEVSEDAPLFHTDIRSSHMQVIELPKDDPAMQVDKKVIGVNDNFKAVCTVGPSYPPANITWYINGRKVSKSVADFVWSPGAHYALPRPDRYTKRRCNALHRTHLRVRPHTPRWKSIHIARCCRVSSRLCPSIRPVYCCSARSPYCMCSTRTCNSASG